MRSFFSLLFAFCFCVCSAQIPHKPSSADIYQSIKKLNVLGSVLYVAAHPDDENQRLISYFSNKKLYDVTYLSLTRGDGGQNLIGPEIRELLGVLRTEELLAARRVDGGSQLFSRANDFGYSKDPNETLRIWDKELVLEDIVRAYRTVRPDVVIHRFAHEYNQKTHGHHTTASRLSYEAFREAAKAERFPDQVNLYGTWQAQRQFWNLYPSFFGKEAFERMDKSAIHTIDVGVFLPLKGKSNNEVAAEARSQHLCQGFGTESVRGTQTDYLQHIQGSKPTNTDIFSDISTTWSRVEGGAAIEKAIEHIAKNFDLEHPAHSIPALIQARAMMLRLSDDFWKNKKLAAIEQVIFDCAGLYIEATATEPAQVFGEAIAVNLEVTNRSNTTMQLKHIQFLPSGEKQMLEVDLASNIPYRSAEKLEINGSEPRYTAPYWLLEKPDLGMYKVTDKQLIGLPNTPRIFKVTGTVRIADTDLPFVRDVVYKSADPAVGERYAPFEVTPPVFVEFLEKMTLMTGESVQMKAKITAGAANTKGILRPTLPDGWTAKPTEISFDIALKGASKFVTFDISAPAGSEAAAVGLVATVDGNTYTQKRAIIDYAHVPKQTVLLPSEVRVVPIEVRVNAKKIGYYQGAGDAIPEVLELIGCSVTELADADMRLQTLKQFDAVVLGVRAYNTQKDLKYAKNALLEYVKQGGTVLTQYNTNHRLLQDDFAPYALTLSRDRVTEEDAPVHLLRPKHQALTIPNRITQKDFDGWVQERGLYFPNVWSSEWTPLLSMADTDAPQSEGSLLVAAYDDGYYVYTGLSFFRELPAGVPGAIRLFANLISLQKLP